MSTSGSATWALISDTSNVTITNAQDISANAGDISTHNTAITGNTAKRHANQANISTIVGAATPYECAPLNSPVFTGTPLLPTLTEAYTQSPSDNSTKLATTEWVTQHVQNISHAGGGIAKWPITPDTVTPAVDVSGTPVRVTLVGGGGAGGNAGTDEYSGGGGGGGSGAAVVFWMTWVVGSPFSAPGSGGTPGNGGVGGSTSYGVFTAGGGHQGGNAPTSSSNPDPSPGAGGAGGVVTSADGNYAIFDGIAGAQGSVGFDGSGSVSNHAGDGGAGAPGWRSSLAGAGGKGGNSDGVVPDGAAEAPADGHDGTIIFEWFS